MIVNIIHKLIMNFLIIVDVSIRQLKMLRFHNYGIIIVDVTRPNVLLMEFLL